MTRKHFQAIADTIRFMDVCDATREVIAKDFASTCAGFNGRFDKQRFIAAATKPAKGEPGYAPS
jgi:hypothetical protein